MITSFIEEIKVPVESLCTMNVVLSLNDFNENEEKSSIRKLVKKMGKLGSLINAYWVWYTFHLFYRYLCFPKYHSTRSSAIIQQKISRYTRNNSATIVPP